jgi:methylenetetrahydrofolate dehydrogenase (NADP+) / methenyltetrahydrofolate cyclohydrolase
MPFWSFSAAVCANNDPARTASPIHRTIIVPFSLPGNRLPGSCYRRVTGKSCFVGEIKNLAKPQRNAKNRQENQFALSSLRFFALLGGFARNALVCGDPPRSKPGLTISFLKMPQLLDGNRVRDQIKAELAPRIAALPRRPGLAVVLVGNNPASEIYVRNKIKTSHDLGIFSESITPPATITTDELLAIVDQLNGRHDIDGILVQLPLPAQVDTKRVLLAVAPAKDVDGFHPCNVGNLVAGLPGPRACTPAGVIELLKRYDIPIAGKRAVVVGRSDIVGKPAAMLLLHEHATVTICHSRTPDLAAVCREAEILVAALGRPATITRDFIRPGATVIDVGTTRIENRAEAERIFRGSPEKLAAFDKKGGILVGDVHPLDVVEIAGAYTPVPGGVGPLTIAMLMANTVASAERRQSGC